MFGKILIANRGEIACRIIRACTRLGIASVAVHSDADATALHVAQATEACAIGPAPARDSYLRIDRILDAARRTGAEAIHPGYGFLSENAEFAEACAASGIVFIGPPAAAIRAMGSKAEAKARMEAAGVKLVPGYHGADQDPRILADAARRIGFPVLVKASAGGGGKGMKIADHPDALADAIASAAREARSSFGDSRLLIEKYLQRPRHIEVQVFADQHGNYVHLFERDCSIQRRHQKVLEEAPAPGLDPARRAAMGAAAIAAARAVDYVGAGTIEFIAEGDEFYFMEMNTRLQVEHPVTEAITGQDLVEWQIRVAAGQPLPLRQDQLAIHGHAIEARLYAEDPAQDFRPSIGRIRHLVAPVTDGATRIDSGVCAGDSITQFYDPMIAKLIVHGTDRDDALARLRRALAAYEIAGVTTNLELLRATASDPEYGAGGVDTGFLGRHPAIVQAAPPPPGARILAAAAIATRRARSTPCPASPWDAADSWSLNLDRADPMVFLHGADRYALTCHTTRDGLLLDSAGTTHLAAATPDPADAQRLRLTLDGYTGSITVLTDLPHLSVIEHGITYPLRLEDPTLPEAATAASGAALLAAPLPARIVRILAAPGQTIRAQDPLVVIEAMKMEMVLPAPRDGVVAEIRAAVGDMVAEGEILVRFATES